MAPPRSFFAVATTAMLLLLAPAIEARCHNLSSTAFTHCPKYGDGSSGVVKAAATAPFPLKEMTTGIAKHKEGVQQQASVKIQENLPTDTSTDATPWLYGMEADQALPAPSATLMAVVLGSGTQNYTCPSVPSATPTQVGATAELYHLTKPSVPVADVSIDGIPAIGKHYFNSAGTPSFQFFDNKALGLLQTAKKAQIPAPGGAGVPWLQLVTTGTGKGDLQEVYRVQTQGGSPPPGICSGKAPGTPFEVPYRAQYWFYGTPS